MDNKNENEQGLSPTPVKKKVEEGKVLLTFSEIVPLLVLHKKIHKLEWKDKEFYGVIDNDILKLHKPDGNFYEWTLHINDIAGNDYILIE